MENIESFSKKKPDGFLIVGIGASAGGIQALRSFFQHVPVDSGIAYVVILHLSPDHDSQLAQVLQAVTEIPVEQVTQKVKIEPDHIYVVPPNQHLTLKDGFISPSVNLQIEERRAPVDIFFRNLADTQGPRAVCVVLSGTGANGSMGLKRIKEMGGVAYVQNPREAEFNEMPRNSIATELVDEVLPVAEIPASIIAYRNSISNVQIPLDLEKQPELQQQALREIFTELRVKTGHDFSNYKRATLLRRIERRISVRNLTSLPAYAALLRQNPDETNALLKDLLISVTNFFRDQKPFQSVEQDVVPGILHEKKSTDQVRIWVAGCATGEEAYSLAMLIAEKNMHVTEGPVIQIFATDIDEAAIAVAREGLYTINDAADVSPERLRRFFNKEGDGYRVSQEIRQMVLFANHNFLKDPPFSRLDMVSCRNVLIYLNHVAQERVMETFHFALKPGGFLFLGSSESVDGAGDLYAVFNRENHIFQTRNVSSRHYPIPELIPRSLIPQNQPSSPFNGKESRSSGPGSFSELHTSLLEEYAPPSAVINEEYDIVHLSEKVGKYLEFSGGEPTQNLLKLVRPEIRLELRTALYQAVQRKTAVESRSIEFHLNGEIHSINLHIRPVRNTGNTAGGFILVIFKPNEDTQDEAPVVISLNESVAKQLEEELIRIKEQLLNSNEQHEFQAEELKAANEELQAMNEEMRSAAEELETGKEELQSINEELRTVNQELKVKIDEITLTRDNLQNLVNSADVGTIFLDRSFRTRLFTPAVRGIFNVILSDYGRPISDITNKLAYPNLLQDAETVLDKLIVIEREVTTTDNHDFMMRLLPYRTAEDRINGVVITFFDISQRKHAERALRKSEEYQRLLIESAKDYAIFTLDIHRRIVSWSHGAEAMLGYSEHEITGQLGDIIFTPEDRENNAPETEAQKADKSGIAQNERWHIRKDGSRFWGSGSVSPLRDSDGTLLGLVKIMRDLTESKEAEERYRIRMEKAVSERTAALKESREQYASLVENTPDVITRWNKDLTLIFANSAFERKTNAPNESLYGKTSSEMGQPDEIALPFMRSIQSAIETGEAIEHFDSFSTPNGKAHFYSRIVPEKNDEGEVETVLSIERDITELKEAEQSIILIKEELAQRATDKYLTLFNSIDEAVVWCELVKDENGHATDYRLLELNPAFEKMTGLTVEGSKGKTARTIVPGIEDWWIDMYASVATEGKVVRFENKVSELGRWFSAYASPVGNREDGQFVIVYSDITERKRAEEILHTSEERKSFLLKLSDALRSLSHPLKMQSAVSHIILDYFQADRCYYCELEGDTVTIQQDAARQGLPSVAAIYSLSNMPIFKAVLETNRRVVIRDVNSSDEVMDDGLKQLCLEAGIMAYIDVPVMKNGQLAGIFCITQSAPRNWTDAEISLAEEAVERTWNAVERARVAEALRESEERFRLLVNASSDSVYTMSADWHVMFNLEGKNFLADTDRAKNSWMQTYIPEPEWHAVTKVIEEAIRNKTTFELEHTVHDAHRNLAWTYSRAVPKLDEKGDILEWIGTASNITHRKKAEEALRISEKRFRTLTDAVPQVIWSNDAQGKANYFNQRWYDYSGLTYEQSFGVGWEAIVHPDDAPTSLDKWHEALSAGKTFDTEYRLRNAAGQYCWFVGRNVPLKDDSGKITGWFGSATDINDLKDAEEAVRTTADRLQLALDAGKFGTYEYDFKTGVYLCTEQYKANFGFAQDEPVSLESLEKRILPADRIYMETSFDKAPDKDTLYSTEYRTQLPEGGVRWIRSVGRYVFDENGKSQKLVGITVDITEEKMFTDELSKQVKERTKELQQSNNDLLQFAHIASHDLKEPVRKIKTFNHRIISDFSEVLPEKVLLYLDKIKISTDRMYSIVDGILNYSKLTNGKQSFKPVDLNEVIKAIETDLELLVQKKDAKIRVAELPVVTADELLMYQLFYNLILNSLKFSSEEGAVVINIDSAIVNDGNTRSVKITLSDNGIGFEQEFEKEIFEAFTRLNPVDEYEGTGLGLALCKKIVERHNGSITAIGNLGKGAAFIILLPIQ